MAVTSSGMIGLNEIHVEAGGSSGSACTIHDSDIRGLIGKSSGAYVAFSNYYGASSSLDSITVTVGYKAALHPTYAGPWYGYQNYSGTGSVSKTSVAWRSGASYHELNAQRPGIYNGRYQLKVSITGGTAGNSGWTSITIGGSTYSRASFSYGGSPSAQFWTRLVGYTSPYGTTVGATKSVVFN